MIEVSKAADELSAPAQSLDELYSRLAQRVGQFVEVNIQPLPGDQALGISVNARRSLGALKWLRLTKNRIYVHIDSPTPEFMDQVDLRTELKALVDGQWRNIHSPLELIASLPGEGALDSNSPQLLARLYRY